MGPATTLTADLGNRRCKLRLWRDDRPAVAARADVPAGAELAAAVAAFLRGRTAERAALSSVASPAATDALAEALAGALGRPALEPDPGVVNATERPEEVGADRLFAARGALEVLGRSAVVVDAGTALTVDAVRVDGGRPEFLGGAIAVGAGLAADALSRAGARLVRVEPEPGAPALGRSTRGALLSGLLHGLRGTARELARRVADEAGLAGATVVVTGGDAPLLDGVFEASVTQPDLVHLGLWAAARGAAVPGDARGPFGLERDRP